MKGIVSSRRNYPEWVYIKMNEQDVFTAINSGVVIDRAKFIIAKQFVLSEANEGSIISTEGCMKRMLQANHAEWPSQVILHPDWDIQAEIQKVILSLSYRVAFCEALLSLVQNGLLIAFGERPIQISSQVSHTTIRPGHLEGGSSSGWNFPDWGYDVPGKFRLSALIRNSNTVIADPDLFLQKLNIPNLHPEVEEALFDAARCLRVELYTPCLAMLVKAIEGAWIELGVALIDSLPEEQSKLLQKKRDEMLNPNSSIVRIIKLVTEVYERRDLFGDISKKSGVQLERLRSCAEWSNQVRISRNTVHYGVTVDLPNNYEKVATLLLGVSTHFGSMYRLISCC